LETEACGLRLNKSLKEEFKHICDVNHVTISKVLQTMIVLFMNDFEFQRRVLREASKNVC